MEMIYETGITLIHALQNASWREKKRILHMVKNEHLKKKNINKIIEFANGAGGIEYAEMVMNEYLEQALSLLKEFNESIYRDSLADLVHFTIERNK